MTVLFFTCFRRVLVLVLFLLLWRLFLIIRTTGCQWVMAFFFSSHNFENFIDAADFFPNLWNIHNCIKYSSYNLVYVKIAIRFTYSFCPKIVMNILANRVCKLLWKNIFVIRIDIHSKSLVRIEISK